MIAAKPTGIVISPGPCDPDRAGICLDLVAAAAAAEVRAFGVCLGHQTIGQAFGGHRGARAAADAWQNQRDPPRRRRRFQRSGQPVRRHPLSLADDRSRERACGFDGDRRNRGWIGHGASSQALPIHGVQFHPESIASQNGHRLLANFLALAGFTGTAMQPIDALEHRLRKAGT